MVFLPKNSATKVSPRPLGRPPKVETQPEPEKKEEVQQEEIEESEEESPTKIEKTWTLKEIPIETQKVIFNEETEEAFDLMSAVVEILNRLEPRK